MSNKYIDKVHSLYPNISVISEYLGSKNKILLKCNTCDTSWNAIYGNLVNRGDKSRCPKCSPRVAHNRKTNETFKSELLSKYPKLTLLEEYKTAKTSIKVRGDCGHEWDIIPTKILEKGVNSICRICAGIPVTTGTKPQEFFEKEVFDKFNLKVVGKYISAKSRVTVRGSCGHEWDIIPNALLTDNSGSTCRTCFPNVSKGEEELYKFIFSVYPGWIERNDRSILGGKELDIVLPDLGIAFEYNGIYWHKEDEYSFNFKTEKIKEVGYRLVHINEDEWRLKQSIVRSKISSLLNLNDKVYARKCSIVKIGFPRDFLVNNHLQGAGSPTKYNYGLVLDGELIAVMTFNTPRFNNSYNYELVRYCSKIGINVVGGASKLLNSFRKEHKGSIISYSDRRWSNGDLYKSLGFFLSHTSRPNYAYYRGYSKRLSRYQCQKYLLKDMFPDSYSEELTEKEIMAKEGFYPVYDSGNDVWVLDSKGV